MQHYEENYYRACALILKHGAKLKRTLLNRHLQNSGQTLYQFIEVHGHDILHLYVGKIRCCRCNNLINYVPPTIKTLYHAQMEVLFCKNGHLHEHRQGVLQNKYCCRYPNPALKPQDLDISLLNILFSNFCNDLFWESCINGQTVETFLNNEKHSLYHLWRITEPCCFKKCTSVMKSKTRRIGKLQWETLFVLTVNPLICKDGEACSCLYKAISGIQVTDIKNDLASEILHSTSTLKQAVEGIVELRNTYFAHVKDNSLSDMQFQDALNRCENYMKTIAIACQSNSATITEIIENVKEMSLDGSICDQLNTVLLSQIVDKTDITENIKSNDRKLDIIDEKNNRFLEVGQEIKESNMQILENQEKLFQQNEKILAMLSGEKWYEVLFKKVTCFFGSSLSVLGSWFVSPESLNSVENDSGDESELYRFTCKKCRIDFTILEEFLKHKEKIHDKKPRQRVRTTITGADQVWESGVMDLSRTNTRSLDVENFDIENTHSGSLIFVAKLSSAVVASKDKILDVIQAFLINLFQQCSLPDVSLKNIDIKVEVYESFSDEEDDEACDTYFCGRCGIEYKNLGSFLLHTESQEHKLNKKHHKETKSYTQWTDVLTVMSKTPEVTPETQSQEPAASVVEDSVEKRQQFAMLNRLLWKGSYGSFDMRCMVTGHFSAGKSTLVKLLAGDVIPEGRHPTDGISVVEGRCGLDIETKSWILIDPEAYNALDVVYNKVLMTSLEEEESELTEKLDQALDTSPTGYAKATLSSLPSQQSAAAKPLPPHKSSNVPLTVKQMKWKMKTRMTKKKIRRNMEKVLRSGKYKMKVGRLNFWDFSGKYVYLTTHQTFMTFRALFLVVFDGSKDLHEQVPDVLCFPGQHMTPTPAVFLQYWVNSILTYCKVVYAGIPKILFVATHKDKVPKECVETRREELNRGIELLFKDHEGQHHLVFRPLIFVNAKNQDDPEIEVLKKTITELTFNHPCWGERMSNACVPLELEIAELVAEGKQVMSLAEVKELNATSEVSVLSPEQLTDFLHYQHSLGKIVYFDTPQLRHNVIISPLLIVEVMRSFITDVEFWPKDKTRITFKKMSENGMIQRVHLYQIWEQEEFRQILPFREYIFDMLIHLDIVSEQRRYDTRTGSRLPVEHFFVPCMLTHRNDTDFLTQECTPDRTVSLAFVFNGTIIPPALPNRLICACLSMWTLKEYRGRKLMFSLFVGLSFDREHDIVVCVEGNKILLYLIHKRSKGLIVPDIATCVRECLYITLERICEFYQSTIHCKVSNMPFHTEYSCSKLSCFTPEDKMVLETEECLCKHGENIKHNWRVWNQKLEQMQCDLSCPGLSEDALSQIPSNTELLRLSVNLETRMLHDLALHLGIGEMVWNDMAENYPRNKQMVKFLTLMHLKENYKISFAELDNGLREMKITTHKLCVVRRRKQVKSSIPDDILDCIPSDEILDRLAPLIGKIVFQLGIELGLSVEEMECISEKCDRDLTSQNKEVLFTWMKDRTLKPTLRVLEQAFVNIGKGARCLKEVLKDIDPNTLKAIEIVTDRIRGNENRIIQDIQISQILDHMITHLVITVDDRRYIDHYLRKDDQNKALLDIVIKRREPAYSVFIDGLRNYGYEDIANDLKCDSQEMSPRTALLSAENEGLSVWNVPWYKIRLQKNYLKIITDIQHKSIVDHLMTREVVSVDDWEKIEFGKTRQEKNRNLMEMLLHNNERGFNEFLKALRKDPMYADLADQIEKTEVTSRDIAILHTCFK